MRAFLLFCLFFFSAMQLFAQQANDTKQSIISEAIFDGSGNITLSWIPKDDASSYRIRYRPYLSQSWEEAANGVVDSFYVFSEQLEGAVEFAINTENGDFATNYILAGENYFAVDQEERMLLLVTNTIYSELESIIEDYRAVLENELIATELIVVEQSASVPEVKQQIVDKHTAKPLDYILIVGHVAVPYSGNAAIDGHSPDHQGAWVADGYYGELDGNWTDVTVNNDVASREANKNIPGDGKFDQTFFPSNVELPVGRIDFSDLPSLLQSEVELTEGYLLRNMAYRRGQFKATKRAIIDNNFNLEEGFAQGAIKSFHTFLEPDSISYDAFAQCTSQDYLFTFGAGGGNYQGASGIINTNTLVNDSIQSIFTTIFGSYFGDWDISNNLLRAALARGSSLMTSWSGRPIWYFHQMAMGATVGDILLNAQNNNVDYISPFGKRMCHTSLLGDPSLKMYYHQPISNPVIGSEQISWEYLATDPEVVGYTVYYKENGQWNLLGDGPSSETFINIADLPIEGLIQLMVRPVGLIHSRSGSYYNEGIGVPVEFQITNTKEIVASFNIFPNPANDVITISGAQAIEQVLIFDMFGQLVKSTFRDSEIYIASLPAGVYTISVNQQSYRLVKQ